jgi:hypothetical protein
MTVYVLIREDQNQHGYIDTSIMGVFLDRATAQGREASERENARAEGLIVENDESDDWQVSWTIQDHLVY